MYPSPSFSNYQHFAIFFIQPVHFWGKYFKAHPRYPVILSINFSISLIDDDLLDMTTVLLSHLTKLTIIPNTCTLLWFCFYSWFKLDGMPFKSLLSCNNSPWLFIFNIIYWRNWVICFVKFIINMFGIPQISYRW